MLKKTKKSDLITKNKNLSIQFSLDGFSFCVIDADTDNIILFTEYRFEEQIISPELLLSKIIYIFESDKDLQQNFNSVFAIHQNNLATLVPDEYFDRQNLNSYLNFTIKTLNTDFITYDSLSKIKINSVYIPYVNINNYLFQNFGEFEYKHYSTVLIDNVLEYSKNESEKVFFANVSANQLDIIVCKKDSLLLYNTFIFTSKEDFIYYILFTAEQLHLDPNNFKLTFIGDIDKKSKLYNVSYKYIRNISFIKPSSKFFTKDEEFSNHFNFTLLS